MLGRDASVALLAVMMALKCLELRTLRDANIVVCLGYFLIVTNFLYSQTIPTALYMLVVLAWLTATTVSLQDFGRADASDCEWSGSHAACCCKPLR